MSSTTALFKVDGKEFSVISCSYSLGQSTDTKGQPTSKVRGGTISLQIGATDDHSLMEWAVAQSDSKNGSVEYKKSDQDGIYKELKFENGICVAYTESFNASSSLPLTITMSISAMSIKMGDVTHSNA